MIPKVNSFSNNVNTLNKQTSEEKLIDTEISNNLFYNKTEIRQIIPLHESAKQQLDIGIVYTEEFGIRGVIVKNDVVHIMPVDNIVSSLNSQDKGENLVKRIATRPQAWDLVYDETKSIIIIWPKMRAAGKLGEFTTLGLTTSNNWSQVHKAYNALRSIPCGVSILNSNLGAFSVHSADKSTILYRVVGAGADAGGHYWSTVPPRCNLSDNMDKALLPKWYIVDSNNKNIQVVERVVTAVLPKGFVFLSGTVASQNNAYPGGAKQIYLFNTKGLNIKEHTVQDFINNHNNGGGGGKGGPGGGSTGVFNNNTNLTGTTESYNGANPSNPLANAEAAQGEIGGVAVGAPNAQVVDLLKPRSLYDLEARGYWLAFPISDSGAVFSAVELQQICREMAQNVFIHNTLPFYSLHFTKTGALYSVIHPAYQNTLVGKVISQLDYIMKGYLNGAYFSESDLQTFARFGLDEKQLGSRMLLIEDEYKRSNIDGEYTSLAQLIEMYQIKQYNLLDSAMGEKIQQKFQVSFRIIAKQNSIAKSGSTILFDGGFDVFYTIEPHVGVVGSIEQYQQSEEYQILDHFCKHVANDIKLNLPKLGICKQYFMMLDVICGLSYYYSSLKEQELVPKFKPVKALSDTSAHGQLPAYPKTKIETKTTEKTLFELTRDLNARARSDLNQYLIGNTTSVSPELQSGLAKIIQESLPRNALKFSQSDLNELVLLYLHQSLKAVNQLKKQLLSQETTDLIAKYKTHIKDAQTNINQHESKLSEVKQDYTTTLQQIKTRKAQNLSEQLAEISKQEQQVLSQLESQKATQSQEINKQNVPYNCTVSYNGGTYYSTYDLQRAMRSELDKRTNDAKADFNRKIAQAKTETTNEINTHWNKIEGELNSDWTKNKNTLEQHIAGVRLEVNKIRKENERLEHLRTSLVNNPNAENVAKEITLTLPMRSKELVRGETKDSQLVKVSGGTGFKLTNLTTELENINATALNSQISAKPDLQAVTQSPTETWQSLSIGSQKYQAFYINHEAHSSESIPILEQSLIKPNMAHESVEHRMLQLCSQPPSPKSIQAIKKILTQNPRFNLKLVDSYNNNLVHLAALNNNSELIELLLTKDKSLARELNQFGNSPLHVAAMYGNNAALQALINQDKSNLSVKTINKESVLHMAVLHHQLDCVKCLIDTYGQDINEVGINGASLIYTALFNSSLAISEYLLGKHNLDVKMVMENGNNLLHLAAKVKANNIIAKLLSRDVAINLKNKAGDTPLHIAIKQGNLASVEQLLSKRSEELINTVDGLGNTPLVLALVNNQNKIAEYLLEKGAKSDQLVRGKNALSYAIESRDEKCAIQIIRNHGLKLNNELDQNNFKLACELSLWGIVNAAVEQNKRMMQASLVSNDIDEATCYIDYVVRHNCATEFYVLATQYPEVKKYITNNPEKLYCLAICYGHKEILTNLAKLGVTCPFELCDKPFSSYPSLKDVSVLELAIQHNLERLYSDNFKNSLTRTNGLFNMLTSYLSSTPKLNYSNHQGKNLVYLAAVAGNYQLMEQLIDAGINLVSPNGQHALYALIENNHVDVIQKLLIKYPKQININQVIDTNTNLRPLDLACKLGRIDLVDGLIRCGAKLEEVNPQTNYLPLYYAIEAGAHHIIRLLTKYPISDLLPLVDFALAKGHNGLFKELILLRPELVSQLVQNGEHLVEIAINANNLAGVKILLKLGVRINSVRLLVTALENNHINMFELLLSSNNSLVNSLDENGNSLFAYACLYKNLPAIKLITAHSLLDKVLLTKKPRNLEFDAESQQLAKNYRKLEQVNTAVVQDIQNENKIINTLKTSKLNPNSQFAYSYKDKLEHFSALEIAILENKYVIVKELLNTGKVNPQQINSLGLSALHLMVRNADAKAVVELFEVFKLNVNARAENGLTLLHVAALANNTAMVDYLINSGVDLYAELSSRQNVVDLLLEQKNFTLLKHILLEHNYDLNYKNSRQVSLLALIVQSGEVELAREIIKQGADVFALNGFKQRPILHHAVMSQNLTIVNYILSLGVSYKATDSMGMTSLHVAAKLGHQPLVTLLSKDNPKVLLTRVDKRGRTTQDFAWIHRHKDLAHSISNTITTPEHRLVAGSVAYKEYKAQGKTPLELAITTEDQGAIIKLLAALDLNDERALSSALSASGGVANLEILKLVVDKLFSDKHVAQKANHHLTGALVNAIAHGKIANLEYLMRLVNLDEVVFSDGSTPLELACHTSNAKALRIILEYYNNNLLDFTKASLFGATTQLVKSNNLTMLKQLLDNYPCDLNEFTDGNGDTLLHIAATNNHAEMIVLLLGYGACDTPNYLKTSATDIAEQNQLILSLKYLHMAADPFAIFSCLAAKPIDYVEFAWLVRVHDLQQSKDTQGRTLLQVVLALNDSKALQVLLDARINITDKDLENALGNSVAKAMRQHLISFMRNDNQLATIFECISKASNYPLFLKLFESTQAIITEQVPRTLYQDILRGSASIYQLFEYKFDLANLPADALISIYNLHEKEFILLLVQNATKFGLNKEKLTKLLNNADAAGNNLIHLCVEHADIAFISKIANYCQLASLIKAKNNQACTPIDLAFLKNQPDIFNYLSQLHPQYIPLEFVSNTAVEALWQGQALVNEQQFLDAETNLAAYACLMGGNLVDLNAEKITQGVLTNLTRENLFISAKKLNLLNRLSLLTTDNLYSLTRNHLLGAAVTRDITLQLVKLYSYLWINKDLMLIAYTRKDLELLNKLLEQHINPYTRLKRISNSDINLYNSYKIWHENKIQELMQTLGFTLSIENRSAFLDNFSRFFAACNQADLNDPSNMNNQSWILLCILTEYGLNKFGTTNPQQFIETLAKHCLEKHGEFYSSVLGVIGSTYISHLRERLTNNNPMSQITSRISTQQPSRIQVDTRVYGVNNQLSMRINNISLSNQSITSTALDKSDDLSTLPTIQSKLLNVMPPKSITRNTSLIDKLTPYINDTDSVEHLNNLTPKEVETLLKLVAVAKNKTLQIRFALPLIQENDLNACLIALKGKGGASFINQDIFNTTNCITTLATNIRECATNDPTRLRQLKLAYLAYHPEIKSDNVMNLADQLDYHYHQATINNLQYAMLLKFVLLSADKYNLIQTKAMVNAVISNHQSTTLLNLIPNSKISADTFQLVAKLLEHEIPNINKCTNLEQVITAQKTMSTRKIKQDTTALEKVRLEFSQSNLNLTKCLTEDQINTIVNQYQEVETAEQQLRNLSSILLDEEIIKVKLNLSSPQIQDKTQYIARLLAIANLKLEQHFNIHPHKVQTLAVLGLLLPRANVQGVLAQIKTGEGKSTIVALLALVEAAHGKCVDIITSTEYLSLRDEAKYKEFFNSFHIITSNICTDKFTPQHFSGQIIFGTNYNFEFALLFDNLYQYKNRVLFKDNTRLRPLDCVIIDEADNMLVDKGLNSARIAIPCRDNLSNLYPALYELVKNHEHTTIEQLMGECTHLVADYALSPIKLRQLLVSAHNALFKYQENIHYCIKNQQVIIIDQDTGRLSEASRWQHGLHQFIEYKHSLPIKEDSLTLAGLSHPAFFNEYAKVYGVTGTIGEDIERQELADIYHLDTFDVPTHKTPLRKKLATMVTRDQLSFNSALTTEVTQAIKSGRPCLILCRSVEESIKLGEFIKSNFEEQAAIQLLNDVQHASEDFVVQTSGVAANITVATNAAGRGTDISLTPAVIAKGGLHVIFTFYPDNKRIEDQGAGRAGRQGNLGSYRIIIAPDDIALNRLAEFNINNPTEDILNTYRKIEIMHQSKHRVLASQINIIQHQILNKFIGWHASKNSNIAQSIILSKWAEFYTNLEDIEQPQHESNLKQYTERLELEFAKFMQDLNQSSINSQFGDKI